ncbi:MAG TPA: hypothetical protein VHY91_24000 [Pirellulales bacterium]|jgi:hypothetical protein|nr:hypothetical protein [Pirellulales bacterium]
MSEEKKPNWPLACLTMLVLVGALVALAIPSLRIAGGLILFAYWAAVSAGTSYAWYGASWSDVWILLASGVALCLIGAVFPMPTQMRIFWFFAGMVNVLHAWWRSRRLKAGSPSDP